MSKLTVVIVYLLAVTMVFSMDPANDASQDPANNIKAARSVHLAYQAPEAVLFYNEVIVEQSQVGTYFSVCGFNHGYFGIQQRANDKVVIFSIWDPGRQDNPDRVEEQNRVQVLYKDPDVDVRRFGGEGTGGQSFLEYDWKPLETYKFLVKATVQEQRTEYAAFFYINETRQWKHLVTFSTLAHGDLLKGYYSFVEDFRRDGKSVHQMRRAKYVNGWIQTAQGEWIALTRAKFTADGTELSNIDAGSFENGFFLQTGGDTENHTPLWSTLERLPSGVSLPESSTN